MAKQIKRNDLYVGQLIVLRQSPDAQVYTIGRVDGHTVTLCWYEGTRFIEQRSDYAGGYLPTLQQIEYSIEANGPLAKLSAVASAKEVQKHQASKAVPTAHISPMMPSAYTQTQFVEQMNIGRTTFFREIRDGRLKCFKIGRRWYISHEAAAEWLQRKESGFVYTP